jgi:hypothetical protein
VPEERRSLNGVVVPREQGEYSLLALGVAAPQAPLFPILGLASLASLPGRSGVGSFGSFSPLESSFLLIVELFSCLRPREGSLIGLTVLLLLLLLLLFRLASGSFFCGLYIGREHA